MGNQEIPQEVAAEQALSLERNAQQFLDRFLEIMPKLTEDEKRMMLRGEKIPDDEEFWGLFMEADQVLFNSIGIENSLPQTRGKLERVERASNFIRNHFTFPPEREL